MNIVEKFSKYLENIEYPKNKTSWNIAGIIKGQNGFYKFDVRDMFKMPDGTPAQKNRLDTKADKMVLEMKNNWVILDINELNHYVKKHKLKIIYLDNLLPKLDWTINLNK
jgi:hypothetical protein